MLANFDHGWARSDLADGGAGSLTSYNCGDPTNTVAPSPDAGFVLTPGGFDSSSVAFAEINGNVAVDNANNQYLGCVGMTLDSLYNAPSVQNANKATYDLSQAGTYGHLVFWAKMSGDPPAKVQVQLPTTNVDCATNGCWGQLFNPTSSWAPYSIPLNPANLSNLWSLSPPPPAFDPTKSVAIQWQVQGPNSGSGLNSYDLSIDQVYLAP
jgi:hypothetical protein